VLAVLVAVAGCGGQSSTPAPVPPGAPRPAQSLSTAVAGFEKALRHPTCSGLEPFVHSQARTSVPGGPLTRRECRVLEGNLQANLSGFHASATSQFGTAGLADAEAGGRNQAVVFALDTDRRWKFVFAISAKKQIGTAPADSNGFDRSASGFVNAVRARNCNAVYALMSVSSPDYRSAQGDKRTLCRSLLRPLAKTTVSAELRSDRSAAPRRMGATQDFAFYGLRLRSGRFETVVMITQPSGAPPQQLTGKSRYGFLEAYVAREPRG
jgi:hypothetical protein